MPKWLRSFLGMKEPQPQVTAEEIQQRITAAVLADRLRQQNSAPAPAASPPATPAPPPAAAIGGGTPKEPDWYAPGLVFIDRDDFMKTVGTTATIAVWLDAKVVHNGPGGVAFWTHPDGHISTVKPVVPVIVAPPVVAPVTPPVTPPNIGQVGDVNDIQLWGKIDPGTLTVANWAFYQQNNLGPKVGMIFSGTLSRVNSIINAFGMGALASVPAEAGPLAPFV